MGLLRSTVTLLLALSSAPGAAQSDATLNGLGLLERCHALSQIEADPELALDQEIRQNYGYCLGYVVGFVSGFAGRDALGTEGRFCPPANARISDFVAAIQRWMVGHPEGLEQPSPVVTVRAFQAAYPCPAEALRPKQ